MFVRSFRSRVTLLAAVILLGAVLAPSAARADAQRIEGPFYPPSWSSFSMTPSGDSGRAGGLTWSYAGLDLTQQDALFWGPWDSHAIQLAFDGISDAPGETLALDPAQSDFANGKAVYTGSATLSGYGTFPTRYTLVVSAGSGPVPLSDPASLGISGADGVVALIGGNYQANSIFEVLNAGVWTPAKTFFDNLPNKSPGLDKDLVSNISAGYWFRYVAPSAPRSLSAVPGAALLQVNLTWAPPTYDGHRPITGYNVYRGSSSGGESKIIALGAGATSYTDTAPLPLTTYYYEVTAVNDVGESVVSNEACSKSFPWLAQLGC